MGKSGPDSYISVIGLFFLYLCSLLRSGRDEADTLGQVGGDRLSATKLGNGNLQGLHLCVCPSVCQCGVNGRAANEKRERMTDAWPAEVQK